MKYLSGSSLTMPSASLTDHLLSVHTSQLRDATTHPFLTQAGLGTLPSRPLCQWLVQDKYYQFGYVNFMGRLIAKLDLTSYAFPVAGVENLQWKTLVALVSAMNAIKTEIDFYNHTVENYSLKLEEVGPNEVTKQYLELFEESSQADKPMVWGLAVLWATEFVSIPSKLLDLARCIVHASPRIVSNLVRPQKRWRCLEF